MKTKWYPGLFMLLLTSIMVSSVKAIDAPASRPASAPGPSTGNDSGSAAFSIAVSVPAGLGGSPPGATIRVSESGVSIWHEGKKYDSDGTPQQIAAMRKAAEQFIRKPANFATVDVNTQDGDSMYVFVSSGGHTRAAIISNDGSYLFPKELAMLLSELRTAIPQAGADRKAKTAFEAVLQQCCDLDRSSSKYAKQAGTKLKQILLIIPNDSGAELVRKIFKAKENGWPDHWIIQCLSVVAHLPEETVGDEIYAKTKVQRGWSNDFKLQVLGVSVKGGCTEGMGSFAAELKAARPARYESVLEGAIAGILGDDALQAAITGAAVKRLGPESAAEIWDWLIAHRAGLRYDKAIGKYHWEAKREKGNGTKPSR